MVATAKAFFNCALTRVHGTKTLPWLHATLLSGISGYTMLKDMPWTLDEIESDWLGGERVQLPPEDVVRAFAVAEQARGREWVLSTTRLPGGGRQYGFAPFLRVYAFGKRIQGELEHPARMGCYGGCCKAMLQLRAS